MLMLMLMKNSFLMLLLLLAGCKQVYEPPAIKAANHYLLVDGVINTLPDSKTTILLSKTRNLTDTFQTSPELSAAIQIEAQGGTTYSLQEGPSGTYSIDHLTLNAAQLYRLKIRTVDGEIYLSDFVSVKQTPTIDSLTWVQNNGVAIYVSTHDPLNKARYYRWDFIETWQYSSFLRANFGLGISNGLIFIKDQITQTSDCWMSGPSTEISLANSVRSTQDVIDRFQIAVIPNNSEKMGIRYSVLVKQYALTEDAYAYWEILQTNTQQLGTLFDAQPGQLKSNLHNISNPEEPVIGYVSACAVQEKRLFITHLDLINWDGSPPPEACQAMTIGQNPSNFLIWNYPDTTFQPWYFVTPDGLMIAKKDCLDCTRRGGKNQKPSFW